MSPDELVRLVVLLGWLALVAGGLASMRLGWSRGIRYALLWAAIFSGMFLLFETFG